MKGREYVTLSVLLLCFFCPTLLIGAQITQSVRFSPSDLSLSTLKGYDLVTMPGCELTNGDGEPQLPVQVIRVAIPPGARIESVEAVSAETDTLRGGYLVYPCQPPQPLSVSAVDIRFAEPRQMIYNSPDLYPGRLVELTGVGHLAGQRIASLLIYPVQYIPAQRKLLVHRRIDFAIRYTDGVEHRLLMGRRGEYSQTVYLNVAKNLISNPENLSLLIGGPSPLQTDTCEYLIITNSSLASEFQRLADWKTRKGVPARVVLIDSIYGNCPGWDNAEKVRNFLIDACSDWGATWVLLGGDPAIVPDRAAYAMTCGYGGAPDEDSIRCDLYYSDLDGTWDLDGDHIYGEVEDSIDMYPDVFVGRATVANLSQTQIFVDKVLTYEKNPPLDYQLKMLFAAEVMWSNPYTDGGIAKDFIDDNWVPPRFDPILKLYQSSGNENKESVMAAMNDGQSIINHNGHAWIQVISVGDGYLTSLDMIDSLYNTPRFSILFSIGCWPAAFDHDWCIGKCFVISPQGGGVAFIGNSRYGWGSPGNPEHGYSDKFDQQFFRSLLQDDIPNIGAALADAKAFYVSRSGQENVYRWCEYELSLLGDPEMPVWTDLPLPLAVEHPDTVPPGASSLTVTVRSGQAPVKSALVCVAKESEVYERGLTGPDGQVRLTISPSSPGSLSVTVTAPNFLSYEGSSQVLAAGPWVGYFSHQIVDTIPSGNGDGLVNPGETIGLPVTLKNYGTDSSYGVAAALRTDDPLITITDGLDLYGDIAAGDTCASTDGFDFSVGPEAQNGHVVYFTLELSDESSNSWSSLLSTTVATPDISYEAYHVDDTAENNNGIPEPGEHIVLTVTLKNSGLGLARGVTAELATADPDISIPGGGVGFGDIQPDSTGGDTFGVDILSSCPVPHFPRLYLEIQTSDGHAFTDNFLLTIGQTGFCDDMERGAGGWTHGGTGDLWHLSTHRNHSSSHSWYCGNEGSWVYDNNMDCWLLSPRFALAPESKLTFWRWFDVAIYGITGLVVEMIHGSGVDTLDFIGSGGALDSLYMGDDWFEESYDLSSYPAGDTVQIRFSFRSDEEPVAEGFYIDNFCCIGIGGVVGIEEEAGPQVFAPAGFNLAQNHPNPFSARTTIGYQVLSAASGRPSEVALKVYDLAGRLVRTLVNEPRQGGSYSVSWDGRDSSGREVAAGVYFCRLSATHTAGMSAGNQDASPPEVRTGPEHASGGRVDEFAATKKMILLR